jgi:hypothetical protein
VVITAAMEEVAVVTIPMVAASTTTTIVAEVEAINGQWS